MRGWLRRSLGDVASPAQADAPEALRRRQVVVVAVVAVGAAMLAVLLRLEPGSAWFHPVSAALALVWAGGAVLSGPLRLGRIRHRSRQDLVRPVVAPIVLGLALAAVFAVGGLVVREIPWLEEQGRSVVDVAEESSLALLLAAALVNGLAEELFFRGAAYSALPAHPVVLTTAAYALVTLATGNVLLCAAAALLGAVVALERRASGGVLAPVLTHCTWSVAMLAVLPLLFG